MQNGRVYRNGVYVGLLSKVSEVEYKFKYDLSYLKIKDIKAFSLSFPLQEKEFTSSHLFAFFFNMLAEGSMKDLQCKQLKIDKDDNFSRLLKTANQNTIGSVTIEEFTHD